MLQGHPRGLGPMLFADRWRLDEVVGKSCSCLVPQLSSEIWLRVWAPNQGFSAVARLTFWAHSFLAMWTSLAQCRMFNSTFGPSLGCASSTLPLPPGHDHQNVLRHCQVSSGRQNQPQLRATQLHNAVSTRILLPLIFSVIISNRLRGSPSW